VLIGLSLFLTALLIQPVAADMYRLGWEPLEQGKLSRAEAFEQGTRPLKAYLTKFAREKDVAMLVQITRTPPPRTPQEIELRILVPAYVLSELKAGFQVGAVLFLPFLVIDLVVASLTLSLGMVQLPPVMLSAPFKILLFVLVDGWNLVIGSLLRSFA
jgi:flagellar biosynthetic protein FliP